MIGGLISLLWCIIALALSMAIIAPKTSMFPEIDFASKVTGHEMGRRDSVSWDALTNVLGRLSNAGSREIRKGLVGMKFYLRVAETVSENGGVRPVTLVSEDNGSRLSHRDAYDDNPSAGSLAVFQRFSRASSHE
jgi:hypothetical protein